MKRQFGKWTLALASVMFAAPMAVQGTVNTEEYSPAVASRLAEEIRHELVMLPWYGVFDNLEFRLDGSHVTLTGAVTRPTLKSSAENVVRRIEGVERVSNEIEVLPLSSFDDRVRLATYYAIYGYGPLQRYSMGAQLPIRIIVKNGNVTLRGVVANQTDKNLANIRANGVSGVFSVQNDLQVERERG
ncbi:MAG: BON domain-containing protein [Bryobacteraceae bacterium]